jgi:uncharacterized protein YndB with AHSA1/START domain
MCNSRVADERKTMTETTPASVDEETLEVRRVVLIRAPRERVWEALTTPELIAEWFGDTTTLSGSTVGSTGVFGWDNYGDSAVEVVESVENEVFAFRWESEAGRGLSADNSTVARFTLEDDAAGTRLTVVERGFSELRGDRDAQRKLAGGNREGWDSELDELKAFLERQDSL